MKKFNLTNDEIDIILDLVDDQLGELYNGPEGTEVAYKVDITIMENLKKKLEKTNEKEKAG